MDDVCSVLGCQRLVVAKGLCGTHYKRLQRGRDPAVDPRRRQAAGVHLSYDPSPEALEALRRLVQQTGRTQAQVLDDLLTQETS